jgi:DNA-binding transcriptional LysR family regulator
MLDIPPSDAVIAALEAARTGSMAAAAAELGITHGAVSRRIQVLEHWLGVPIFERLGRGVRLTAQGQIFVRRAERSLASIASLRTELSTRRALGTTRISALPSIARLWLMPRLAALEARAGGTIEVISEHRLVRLEEREADLAIRFGNGTWSGVVSQPMFNDRIVPAASPEVAAALTNCDADDLIRQTLIVDGDGADWRQWCRFAGVRYTETGIRRRFLDYDLAIDAARQGLGIILLRLPLSSQAVQDGSLSVLPFPTLVTDRGHHLVTRVNEQHPRVLAVIAAIRELAGSTLRNELTEDLP